MKQSKTWHKCNIIKRYKRFLADVKLDNGKIITVHTANTGSMRSCWSEGWPAIISDSENESRKYRYSLEMCHNAETWIGVNTTLANELVAYSIKHRLLDEFQDYDMLKREVKYGENSRIDILLSDENKVNCYIEIKNVSLKEDKDTSACFPDAKSERALKHARELIKVAQNGERAVLFFVVQREDVNSFKPAAHIHPEYAEALRDASKAGVELIAYKCKVQPEEIKITDKMPIILD